MADLTYVYHMMTEDGGYIVLQRLPDGKFSFSIGDGPEAKELVFEAAEIVNMGNVVMVTAMAPPTFEVSTPEQIQAYQDHIDQVTSGVIIDLNPEDPILTGGGNQHRSIPNEDGVEA